MQETLMANREMVIPLCSPLGLDFAYLGFPFWAMAHVLPRHLGFVLKYC